ncbi:Multi-sensor hybrid histidine kinase [Citrifermentans bremense]|uniref:histidine kinase n=1 Tax=Citrifermentans bremense TaxID=60035 RepID=A0A6S6LX16_9BACT|nr:PAS domain S-box protein [Citrifermentans bremense]BCG45300.1 Multi-sensor hybrid histidine kinase [Citrifermentans bremense]
MLTVPRKISVAVTLLSLALWLLLLGPLEVQAADRPHVLALNSYNDGYEWSDDEMHGLRETLTRGFPQLELLIEHLDTKKFPNKKHFPQQADLLAAKYRKDRFQVVIALDNAALEFALRYRDRLFPGTPLVFCGINDYSPGMIVGRNNLTGVAEHHDMVGTLDMALSLHPGTRQVVVVHDYTDTGLAMARELSRYQEHFGGVKLRYLPDLPLEQSVQQLKSLPKDALVLLLSYSVEKGGRSFTQAQVAQVVSSASSVPVYAVHAAQLGKGVVGGRMMEGRIQGVKAAELALRIISGEKAQSIPVIDQNLSQAMVDDAVVRRFGIDPGKIPAGARIINKPVSVYAVNKTAFWTALAVAAAMLTALFTLYFSIERRKRLEKGLQLSEARFRQLFDNAGDAIYIHDFQFKILEANQSACDKMGYSHDELLQLSLYEINHPNQRERLPERLATVKKDGRALYESEHLTQGGEPIPIEVTSRVIDFGERPAILSVVRDISRRKRIERREKARLKILERMATSSNLQELLGEIVRFVEQESPGALCSVLLVDDSGTRLTHGAAPSLPDFYNQAVAGLRIEQGMGSCGTAAFTKQRVVVEDIENHPYWRNFKPARDAGLRACWSEPVLSREGDVLGTFAIYYRSCRSPREGEIALIESAAHMASIAIGRMRSEESRQKLEEQMRQMQKIEAIGQLAGGLAHDFNNLLTPIFVYADIAKRSFTPDDPNWKKLDGILVSAHKAADLTKKLLSFGRKQVLNMEVLELNDVISSLLDLMQRTIRGNIEIRTNLTGYGAPIFADRGQIEQILINFAVNAQDAIKGNGSIVIETGNVTIDDEFARMNPGTKPGPHVLLSFTDDGCGMSEGVLGHIFEPFFTTKPVGQGTGLGLATVYGIVKQHNGWVKVVSQVGQGTSFLLYFPRQAAKAKQEPAQPEPAAKIEQRDSCATILVVDDNESIREMALELLQSSGHHVLIAETPALALKLVEERDLPLDLLVTDVVMPEMSGPELYERLALLQPGLPVLYISGYTFDVKVHNPRQHKQVSFLPKPFTSEQFIAVIEKAIS